MPTPATNTYGVSATPTTTGMELRRGDSIVGRYHFRKNFQGHWTADCYTHDGTGYRLDRVFHCPAGLRAARAAARSWADALASMTTNAGQPPRCQACGTTGQPHYFITSLDGEMLCVECG